MNYLLGIISCLVIVCYGLFLWSTDVRCFIILRCYKSAFLCVLCVCLCMCVNICTYMENCLWNTFVNLTQPGSDIWSSIIPFFLCLYFLFAIKSNLHFYLMIQCKLEVHVITSNLNKCIEKGTFFFFITGMICHIFFSLTEGMSWFKEFLTKFKLNLDERHALVILSKKCYLVLNYMYIRYNWIKIHAQI